MIEHIPEHVETAFLYLHSADTSSQELAPFIPEIIERLPTSYIWAGDGAISGPPLMRQGIHYNSAASKHAWFTFPMQDASSPESFAAHIEAMGASLTCAGAHINAFVDSVMARFQLSASQVVLCGYQHGSCAVLSASMMRLHSPFSKTILIEPYILEGYYLKNEPTLPDTTVVCIENQHIRNRVREWLHLETDREFRSYGIATQQVTLEDGGDDLDAAMIREAIRVVESLNEVPRDMEA